MTGKKVLIVSLIIAMCLLVVVGMMLNQTQDRRLPHSSGDDANNSSADQTAAAGTSAVLNVPLTGKAWNWLGTFSYDGSAVPQTPGAFTITFLDDGTIRIATDCNSGTGAYTRSAAELKMTNIATTKMACAQSQESEFLSKLSDVHTHFFTAEGELIMRYGLDGIIRFQ